MKKKLQSLINIISTILFEYVFYQILFTIIWSTCAGYVTKSLQIVINWNSDIIDARKLFISPDFKDHKTH